MGFNGSMRALRSYKSHKLTRQCITSLDHIVRIARARGLTLWATIIYENLVTMKSLQVTITHRYL